MCKYFVSESNCHPMFIIFILMFIVHCTCSVRVMLPSLVRRKMKSMCRQKIRKCRTDPRNSVMIRAKGRTRPLRLAYFRCCSSRTSDILDKNVYGRCCILLFELPAFTMSCCLLSKVQTHHQKNKPSKAKPSKRNKTEPQRTKGTKTHNVQESDYTYF